MTPEMYEKHARMEDAHWWFEGRRQIVRQVLERHLAPRPNRTMLDVGCGTGGMFPLLESFGTVEGAEPSEDGRHYLAQRFPSVKVHPCALPDGLPQGKWDAVTMFDVLEHLEEPIDALRAIRDRLVFDGQLVLTVPAFQFLWSKHDEVNHHFRRYGRIQLVSQLATAGFRVTYVSYFNSILFPAVAAARLVRKLVPSLDTGADLEEASAPVNALLTRVFGAERLALKASKLPIGVSLVAVAQRG